MPNTLNSRSMGYMAIVAALRERLESAIQTDPRTSRDILMASDIEAVLDEVDDVGHCLDPMAAAIYQLIRERNATLLLSPLE